MPLTETRGNLRAAIRLRADMPSTDNPTDAFINDEINRSGAELYDLLIAADEAYNWSEQTFSTVGGTSSYPLDATFYKLKGVDADMGGPAPLTLKPYNFEERNIYRFRGVWDPYEKPRHMIRANSIQFVPPPDQTRQITVYYYPVFARMTNDADTFDGINGWEEYIIADVCVKLATAQESDASVFMAQKMAVKQRIEQMKLDRSYGMPETVVDVERIDRYDRY